jgi:hypothetical protein
MYIYIHVYTYIYIHIHTHTISYIVVIDTTSSNTDVAANNDTSPDIIDCTFSTEEATSVVTNTVIIESEITQATAMTENPISTTEKEEKITINSTAADDVITEKLGKVIKKLY